MTQHATRREWRLLTNQSKRSGRIYYEAAGEGPRLSDGVFEPPIHVREVLPGEVTITREEFRRRMDRAICRKESESLIDCLERMIFDYGILPEGPTMTGGDNA